LVACGLVLVVVQQSEAFTVASMSGVNTWPAVVRPSRRQRVTIIDRRPIKTACLQRGNTWSGIACASLLLIAVGVPRVLQSRALRTPRRLSVGCQGMGSFKVSLPPTAEHRFNSAQEFHLITPSSCVMPQAAVSTAATPCSISQMRGMDSLEGEHVDTSAWCLPREIMLVAPIAEKSESTVTIGCTRPAAQIIGGYRRPVRSRRRQQSRTANQSTRRQTGTRLLPGQPPSVQPMPYDPSRVRMKIQDVLRISKSCVSIAIVREAKMVAAKSEFSHCTSLDISRTEDH